jgi:hypothetical protein
MPDPSNYTRRRFLRWSIAIIAIALCIAGYLLWTSIRYPKNYYSEEQIAPFLTATELELFSVHPSLMDYGDDPFAPDAPEPKPLKTPFGDLHGYPVLGICKITAPDELAVVRKALNSLDVAGLHWGGAIAACFDPRHGVRIRSGGITRDLLICYECSQVQIFRGDTREGDIYFALSDGTQPPTPDGLNAILTSHAIELPKQPKH